MVNSPMGNRERGIEEVAGMVDGRPLSSIKSAFMRQEARRIVERLPEPKGLTRLRPVRFMQIWLACWRWLRTKGPSE